MGYAHEVFDALKLHGSDLLLPQVPQRPQGEKHDPGVDLVGALGGSAAAYFARDAFAPKTIAIAGAAIWGGAYLLGRASFGEPHDYFGRENAPNNLAYGLLALVGGFGSTWVLTGAWHWVRGK